MRSVNVWQPGEAGLHGLDQISLMLVIGAVAECLVYRASPQDRAETEGRQRKPSSLAGATQCKHIPIVVRELQGEDDKSVRREEVELPLVTV